MVAHQLSGTAMVAGGETQDKAEDQVIEGMWKGLWMLTNGTGFPLCDTASCKVCAWGLEVPATS